MVNRTGRSSPFLSTAMGTRSALVQIVPHQSGLPHQRTSITSSDIWVEGGGWRSEDPPRDAVLLNLVPMGPQTPAPKGTQPPAENLPWQPALARDILNCSTDGRGSNDAGHHKITNRARTQARGGTGSETAGNGSGDHASEFPRSEQSQTTQAASSWC